MFHHFEGAFIGITSKCLSNCYFCNRRKYKKDIPKNFDMDFDTFKKIIKHVDKIYFLGMEGDICSHPDSLKFIEEIVRQNKMFIISTNALRNDKDYWKELGKLEKESKISETFFAIYSFQNPDLYKQVNEEIALENLKIFVENGGNPIVRTVLFDYNLKYIDKLKEIMKSLKIENFYFLRSILYDDYLNLTNEPPLFYYHKHLMKLKKLKTCEWKEKNDIMIDISGTIHRCYYMADTILFDEEKFEHPYLRFFNEEEKKIFLEEKEKLYKLWKETYNNRNLYNTDFDELLENNKYFEYSEQFFKKHIICKFRCSNRKLLEKKFKYIKIEK